MRNYAACAGCQDLLPGYALVDGRCAVCMFCNDQHSRAPADELDIPKALLDFLADVQWPDPPDEIPDSARQIYDMGRPKLNDKQQLEGQGISRAVDRLNSGEHRYGFNEYQP